MKNSRATEVIRLGGVEFSPVSKTIKVGARASFLDSRAAAIFSVLIAQFGHRVSKEELLALAWPDRLVHENSVAKAISKLRAAIAGSNLEIAASYGFGYILREADKERAVAIADAEADAVTAPAAPIVNHQRPIRQRFAAFLAGAIVLAVVAFLALDRTAPTQTPIRKEPPITHDRRDAMATILWVDDHPSNNVLEVEEFRRHRIAVHLALSTDDALKLMTMNPYRLVVSDLGRAEDRLAGLKMIAAMRDRAIAIPVIIYTVQPAHAAGQAAQRKLVAEAGASDLAVTPQEVRSKVLGRFGNPEPAAQS